MILFIDDNEAYLTWLQQNPHGFVVNCDRKPSPRLLMYHKADCFHIQRWEGRNLTVDYIKVCSNDLQELKKWAEVIIGGEVQYCRSCSPRQIGGEL